MDNKLNKKLFGDDFAWGVSTAAFQTEGACTKDGKGRSIWDEFTSKKGKVLNGETAETACDFYHRYREDIDLIKQMNIPNFRFSIAWTRILPNGEGEVNQLGIDHYNNVINYCLEQGIEPWVTIYHWDLPQALEAKGGWTNREIVGWFTNYATICAQYFGDRVKHWMVMNEPGVFTGAGYFLGLHAPGRTGLRNYLPTIHHTVLSIVSAAKQLRYVLPDATIGTTFSCSHIEPYSQKTRDINAANRVDALLNRLFIEPLLGLGYPMNEVTALKGINKYILPGDEANMTFDFDFIGIQNYTREIVKFSLFTPYVYARLVKAVKRNVPTTLMGWEVHPPALYQVLKQFAAYRPDKPIYITENGVAFEDTLSDEGILDTERVEFLQTHISEVLKAKNEGVNVKGYFVWTLTDNFEWAEGYHPRFGLIHVDFKTQRRTIKASGRWYGKFLKGDS
ncbi:GH1 family beta-glucosidase [Mucilaginibacter boryungensis]|uniref:Beta-glucosidase n=1 Tax=Mucilaginibacter boryungensis TaxID=768480 RepID=A0ABR9XIA5_9SPHI|nr:GH1 family beta-glucosidase [Mucilaginibacter boryungensis]MBE9667118.1 beta-glucosidase [Mucilaginibacter boryungensis]